MTVIEFGKQHHDTMILLHGGGLSWWNYREVAQKLAEQYHVVLPVLDGHCESRCPFSVKQMERMTTIGEYFSKK